MKKFAFSLERILAFKRTLYEKERNELARLRAERNAIEQRKENTIQQVLEMDARFREKAASGGVKVEDINTLSYHRDNSDKLVKQLKIEIQEKDILIEKQLVIVIELDQDVKSLEKLREKQWEDYTLAAMREEQDRIMEIVSSKFIEDKRVADLEEAEDMEQAQGQ